MPGFDVLNPDLELNQRCFLEASAGTGKTFAIETLFVRLLLEENGPAIDQILVVTFTKAATQELKERIRKKIEEVICSTTSTQIEKKKANMALSSFDLANIFTIHSFCYKSLEENPVVGNLSLAQNEECLGTDVMLRIVKDYLRTSNLLHPGQWEILLKAHGGDFNLLAREVAYLSEKRLPIETGRPFQQIFDDLFQIVQQMKCSREEVVEALTQAAYSYQKMCDRQKNLKKEVLEAIEVFSELFSGKPSFPFQSPLLQMRAENLLKKGTTSTWQHWETLEKKVFPLIEEASAFDNILPLLAEGARKKIEEEREKEELYFYEDLLIAMEKRAKDPLFASCLRSRYKAVFIDEFQDTDRIQWEIFSTLFSQDKFSGAFYLIGDPKQSIYRFRHADLYTFAEAKKSFSHTSTLDVNWRSNPELIAGLNALFTNIDDFLYLPKTKEGHKCPEIYPAPNRKTPDWNDKKRAVHFIVGEDEEFFLFIVEEIKRLHLEQKIPLHKFAVLVKDRFQGTAFCEFAKRNGLTVSAKKTRSLQSSEAFAAFSDLIKALMNPNDYSSVGKVLIGPIFNFPLAERNEKAIADFFLYKRLYEEEGILSCLHEIYRNVQQIDLQFYSDLLQLAELISTEGMTFEKLKMMSADAEILQARNVGTSDGVQVMTIHVSKGLEFDVVFALGLIKGARESKKLVIDSEKRVLTAREDAFQAHLEELEAEKMRLFYVAATRARERLYLPVIAGEKKSVSPMRIFLDKLLLGKSLEGFVHEHPMISLSDATTERYNLSKEVPHLFAPKPFQETFSPRYIHSFTTLAVQSEIIPVEKDSCLPTGKEFGQFMHQLFEHFPHIEGLIEQSCYREWKEPICALMQSALHLPLGNFCLLDVDPRKMLREMEFLYSTPANEYLKGFIDLVFEHEGKLYVLDWKTNHLSSYDENSLKEAMRVHDYYLQAKIYREAIVRYMELLKTDLEFGGIFYHFVRGPAVYKL